MKIVFCLENYAPHLGGVEVMFKHICEELAKNNEVVVVTHRIPGTKKHEVINNVKIERVYVPGIFSRYFFTFLAIPKMLSICKDADVIHTTTYNGAPPARLVAKMLKKPSIITVNEVIGKNWSRLLEMSWLEGKLHEFLEWLVISLRFDRTACISESTKDCLVKVKKNRKCEVAYCGIDYDFWNPKRHDGKKIRQRLGLGEKKVYFFYGRPGPSKGFEHLVKAVPLIKQKVKNSMLVAILSRDKAYAKRYERIINMIREMDIEEDIMILDPVERKILPDYIMAADCVVVPSLTEGFGFCVAESCTLGKVVVASDTTSIPEVISGKYVLVKPADYEDIAKGVINAFDDKYNDIPLKKFTWKACVDKYKKMYNEMVKEYAENAKRS